MKASLLKKVVLVLALAVSPLVHAEESLNLSLLPSTLGDPQRLILKEVVDKQKTSASLLEKYGTTLLSPVPASGLQASQVLMILSRAGAPVEKIKLTSPSDQKVALSPKSAVLQKIREAVIQKAASKHQVDVKVVGLEIQEAPQDLPAPDSFARIQVSLEGSPIQVSFMSANGETLKTIALHAKISLRTTVLAAKRAIMPSETISAADFEERQQELSDLQGLVRSSSEIKEGRWALTQGIEAGSYLRRDQIQKMTSLQKGSLVSLIKRDPSFQIQTLARVKEVIGDGTTVLVENLDSKKEITAKAISATEVEVIQ